MADLIAAIGDPSLSEVDIRRPGLSKLDRLDGEAQLSRWALAHRPDLLLTSRHHSLALAQADEFRKEARPTPTLFVGTELTRHVNSVSLLGGIAIPLPVFDRNRGPIARVHAEAASHRSQLVALETRVKAEIRGALRSLEQAKRVKERLVEHRNVVSQDFLERAFRAYEAGTFSIAELVDAMEALWEARKESLEIDWAITSAEMQLIRAAALQLP